MYALTIANRNYSSWSLRSWLLMRELGIPFEERMRPFTPGMEARDFSPTGKVPCLDHDGETIWDTLAIAEYLAERHDGIWPTDPKARAYARCVAAEMHSGFSALRNLCSMNCGVTVRLHEEPPALRRDIARLNALWNEGLSRFGGPFLVGASFTAADAFFAPVAFRFKGYGLVAEGSAAGYLGRLLALPGMREWHAAALAETWRDAEHEDDVRAAGTILEDLRAPAA